MIHAPVSAPKSAAHTAKAAVFIGLLRLGSHHPRNSAYRSTIYIAYPHTDDTIDRRVIVPADISLQQVWTMQLANDLPITSRVISPDQSLDEQRGGVLPRRSGATSRAAVQ